MSEELIDRALIVIQQARILVDQTRKLRAAQRHTRRSNDPSPPIGTLQQDVEFEKKLYTSGRLTPRVDSHDVTGRGLSRSRPAL
jgi:hypothetical protein